MIAPLAIQTAFAHGGVPVARADSAPDLCDSTGCTSLDIFGGDSAKAVYFRPQQGKDFMVILFHSPADAREIAKFEQTHSADVGTSVRKAALLIYLKSSARVARLRAALTAVR